jgi:hypothetical protein
MVTVITIIINFCSGNFLLPPIITMTTFAWRLAKAKVVMIGGSNRERLLLFAAIALSSQRGKGSHFCLCNSGNDGWKPDK